MSKKPPGPRLRIQWTFAPSLRRRGGSQRSRGCRVALVLKGLINIGGRWWRCVRCGRAIQAACECCEPQGCCKG